jgi:hypothetical protein
LLRWARRIPGDVRRWWRDPAQRAADAPWVFLALWVLLPLVVFCLARSRMPLYLLPLFAPLALLVAMQRVREGRALPKVQWLAAWFAVLVGLQVAAGFWPTHKDASVWADVIRQRAQGRPVTEVVFVDDMTRYGLHLHLGTGTQIEKIALQPQTQSPFNRVYDELLEQELQEHEPDAVWVTKTAAWPEVKARIEAAGFDVVDMGPHRNRTLFRVVPR